MMRRALYHIKWYFGRTDLNTDKGKAENKKSIVRYVKWYTPEKERFSLAPELLLLLLGNPHTPFVSNLKILPGIFGKSLAFIRFSDYNYTVIL